MATLGSTAIAHQLRSRSDYAASPSECGPWLTPIADVQSSRARASTELVVVSRVINQIPTVLAYRVYDVRACIRYYCFPLHRCHGKEKKWCSCVVGLRATREELWQQNEMIFRVPPPPPVVVFVCSSPSRGSASV